MTVAEHEQHRLDDLRGQWQSRVSGLLDGIATWAAAQGWGVRREEATVTDRHLGSYPMPMLEIKLPGGELRVQPVGLQVAGAEGRVEIKAYPTLHRVRLLPQPKIGGGWQVITDSNVPLREPWNAQAFVQLCKDLLA